MAVPAGADVTTEMLFVTAVGSGDNEVVPDGIAVPRAVTVHVPVASNRNHDPDTVQTSVVDDEKLTGSPFDAVASRANDDRAKVREAGGSNETVPIEAEAAEVASRAAAGTAKPVPKVTAHTTATPMALTPRETRATGREFMPQKIDHLI